jgi:anti-sigma regulatory factor (Ser/Thr protein kinase)
VTKPKDGRGFSRIKGYVDYSVIEYISTAAALVIAAEYDRAGRLMDAVPPTINLDEWSESVFSKLYELGFFEIVRLSENVADLYRDIGNVRTMRIVSGVNAADLQRTSENLIGLSKFIDEDGPLGDDIVFALNSALSEAMVNVSRHAYPEDQEFAYRHVGSWWVTATADRGNRRLTVVMYDQGASIPVTLPKKGWRQTVQDFVMRNMTSHKEFAYQDDGTYIEGAMRRGQTQTGEPGRGEGLPQMMELIDICGSGSLTIWSRGGECRYKPGTGMTRRSYPCSIGGTLIEWVIELPRDERYG